jgi:hypothetical protein
LPPSSHVKEPSVTAHYEHYAHDEWSIREKDRKKKKGFKQIKTTKNNMVD